MFIQFLIFVASGLFQVAIAIPMVQRRVPRNLFYGFRTRKTMRDERTWYAANEYCGRQLVLGGAVQCLGAFLLLPICYFLPDSIATYSLSCTAVVLVTVSWVIWRSFAFLNRL